MLCPACGSIMKDDERTCKTCGLLVVHGPKVRNETSFNTPSYSAVTENKDASPLRMSVREEEARIAEKAAAKRAAEEAAKMAAAKRAAEEAEKKEAARKAAGEAAAKKAAEEAAKKAAAKRAAEEAGKKAAEERAAEEAAKMAAAKRAAEEAEKKAAEKRAAEEAAKRAAQEAAAKRAAEEAEKKAVAKRAAEAAIKRAAENAAEEEALKRVAEAVAARKAAEEAEKKAAEKIAAEEAAARKAAEEAEKKAAAKRAAEEAAAARKAAEEAAAVEAAIEEAIKAAEAAGARKAAQTPAAEKDEMKAAEEGHSSMRNKHLLGYKIIGGNFPLVSITLNENQSISTQSDVMVWMDAGITIETKKKRGGSPFTAIYTSHNYGQEIDIASRFPGEIQVLNTGNSAVIVQKEAFLAAQPSVKIAAHVSMNLGDEREARISFQRLSGEGLAFIAAGGSLIERVLSAGETIKADTANIAAFEESVSFQTQIISDFQNTVFGEGLILSTLTGPGKVWLQTLPVHK